MLRAFGNHLVRLGIKGFVALFVNIFVRPLIELVDQLINFGHLFKKVSIFNIF